MPSVRYGESIKIVVVLRMMIFRRRRGSVTVRSRKEVWKISGRMLWIQARVPPSNQKSASLLGPGDLMRFHRASQAIQLSTLLCLAAMANGAQA